MKLKGHLKGIPILILVDSGATHSFVSKKLASKGERGIMGTKNLKIMLRDGHKAPTVGVCKQCI